MSLIPASYVCITCGENLKPIEASAGVPDQEKAPVLLRAVAGIMSLTLMAVVLAAYYATHKYLGISSWPIWLCAFLAIFIAVGAMTATITNEDGTFKLETIPLAFSLAFCYLTLLSAIFADRMLAAGFTSLITFAYIVLMFFGSILVGSMTFAFLHEICPASLNKLMPPLGIALTFTAVDHFFLESTAAGNQWLYLVYVLLGIVAVGVILVIFVMLLNLRAR